MSGIDDKLKAFYDGKALSEAKVRQIQRKAARPRKLRFMYFGPLAAIIFIAVMGKIAFNFIKHDAVPVAPVPDMVTGFTVTMSDSAAVPVRITGFGNADGSAAPLPVPGPDLTAVSAIYDGLRAGTPVPAGTAELEITVAADGTVGTVKTLSRQWNMAASAVQQALADAAAAWVPGTALPAGVYRMTVRFGPAAAR